MWSRRRQKKSALPGEIPNLGRADFREVASVAQRTPRKIPSPAKVARNLGLERLMRTFDGLIEFHHQEL